MTDATTPADETADIWTLARDAYLSGASGAFVCREFELAPSSFWRRAAREGWLKRDRPTPPPEPPLDPDAPVEPAGVARDKAWHRLTRALELGRAAEAQRWLRLHFALAEAAAREEARQRTEARRADLADPDQARKRTNDLRASIFAMAGVQDWSREK